MYIELFNKIYPDFFEGEGIKNLYEDEIFEEMVLPLDKFDKKDIIIPENVTFGFLDGNFNELKNAIESVVPEWTEFFDENTRTYCGFENGNIASFCSLSVTECNGMKIGFPGCVGTVPEYRRRGIGLAMINNATEILKNENCDISYIHYTAVAEWYAKLGYVSFMKWGKNGIIDTLFKA